MKLKKNKPMSSNRTTALESVSVSKGSNKSGYNSLEEGVPNDQHRKFELSTCEVGMSIGSTINMGDFQSLRVDVWSSTEIRKGETRKSAADRLRQELDEVLSETVSYYTDQNRE